MIIQSNIQLTEAAVTEPVTLQEAKDWLKIDFNDDDTLLTSMIKGARKSIENFLNIALVTKTVTLDIDGSFDGYKTTMLPYAKGVSAVVVNSLDDDDVETVLASGTDYFLRGNTLRIGEGRHSVSYTIVPGTIPEDLKEAIKMEVAERYANRGENETTTGLSEGAKVKARPYQVVYI